jgi:hypothetical protein
MPVTETQKPDIDRALEFWTNYQRAHDVSSRNGQFVAIDAVGRRVWFSDDSLALRRQVESAGVENKIVVIRVGSDCLWKKRNSKSWGAVPAGWKCS